MSVMRIRIDDNKQRALKVIASIEGKTMGGIVSELIEAYVNENKNKLKHLSEKDHLGDIMKMSESAFTDWDHQEDDAYNTL